MHPARSWPDGVRGGRPKPSTSNPLPADFREATQVAFFDDMNSAVRTYPDSNVSIEIIDFDPASNQVLNEDEQATFKVRITNNGVLEMNAVTVKVAADNGATLRRPLDVPLQGGRAAAVVASTWVTELVSKAIASIAANGGTATTEVMTLKAPPEATSPTSVNLITASLNGWDAGLGYLLNTRSVARAAVEDTHAAVVHPL
jgi:hypothetical protein